MDSGNHEATIDQTDDLSVLLVLECTKTVTDPSSSLHTQVYEK